MIPALTLCAHLVAAHAATHCAAIPGPSELASFVASNGSKGYLAEFTESDWRELGFRNGIGSPEWKNAEAIFTKNGRTAIKSAWAHVVISVAGSVPTEAAQWLTMIDTQARAAHNRAAARRSLSEERSNPSGVVDLETLHTSGEALQSANQTLAENAAEYRKATGLKIPNL